MGPVDTRLFWRALLIQAILVGALFALLAALLSDDFFEDYGFVAGPIAWVACSLLTGRLLTLPLSLALFSAAAGGVAGTLVGIAIDHIPGAVVAVLVFAASCAGYDPERERKRGEGGATAS
jgi:hypothetical protein